MALCPFVRTRLARNLPSSGASCRGGEFSTATAEEEIAPVLDGFDVAARKLLMLFD